MSEPDPRVVERAARAWKEAAPFAGKNPGAFEGKSADAIIMEAIGGSYNRHTRGLYRAYEKAVVEKARGPGWKRKRYHLKAWADMGLDYIVTSPITS